MARAHTMIQGRKSNGQYAESSPCEACGKPAGLDYWSLGRPNDGGLVLCHRVNCPANKILRKIPDLQEAEAAVQAYIASR